MKWESWRKDYCSRCSNLKDGKCEADICFNAGLGFNTKPTGFRPKEEEVV